MPDPAFSLDYFYAALSHLLDAPLEAKMVVEFSPQPSFFAASYVGELEKNGIFLPAPKIDYPQFLKGSLFFEQEGERWTLSAEAQNRRADFEAYLQTFSPLFWRKVVAWQQKQALDNQHFLQRNVDTLSQMVSDSAIQEGEIEKALDLITRLLAQTLDIEQVGIWKYEQNHIEALSLYIKSEQKHEHGMILEQKHFPHYFEAIEKGEIVDAFDARQDSRTSEFTETYLKPYNIFSLLDVPFFIEGKFSGVICFENVGAKRVWTKEEILLTIAACATVSLTYQTLRQRIAEREIIEKNAELMAQNEELNQQQEEILAQRDYILSQNTELNEKRRQIEYSLQAAERVQHAMLPSDTKLDDLIIRRLDSDYFILNRPRDIVSGDFYWAAEVDNKIILAVIDCTGHGIAGAFMTFVGSYSLEKAVRIYGLTSPAKILESMHETVQRFLSQDETKINLGMDGAIIVLEKSAAPHHFKLTFAGAKRPLWYFSQPSAEKYTEIQEIKGTRQSVGGTLLRHRYKPFVEHELLLQSGDVIFLTTDGIEDQNTVSSDRYGSHNLKSMLENVVRLSFFEQEAYLNGLLSTVLGNVPQRDDILLMGIQL
ncbi:PP2C family protein-serine/threonine phosphatase [Hugenholtzia roseola]|uniref:PP2C family protein-serine/threonine phosphatase n=1 Tax=Hugenholtzia roseola TaxID=1002 RepID=UPI000425E850|nr:SpoIIE family protein phosphatase [Hugenholtzia roseola]